MFGGFGPGIITLFVDSHHVVSAVLSPPSSPRVCVFGWIKDENPIFTLWATSTTRINRRNNPTNQNQRTWPWQSTTADREAAFLVHQQTVSTFTTNNNHADSHPYWAIVDLASNYPATNTKTSSSVLLFQSIRALQHDDEWHWIQHRCSCGCQGPIIVKATMGYLLHFAGLVAMLSSNCQLRQPPPIIIPIKQ